MHPSLRLQSFRFLSDVLRASAWRESRVVLVINPLKPDAAPSLLELLVQSGLRQLDSGASREQVRQQPRWCGGRLGLPRAIPYLHLTYSGLASYGTQYPAFPDGCPTAWSIVRAVSHMLQCPPPMVRTKDGERSEGAFTTYIFADMCSSPLWLPFDCHRNYGCRVHVEQAL